MLYLLFVITDADELACATGYDADDKQVDDACKGIGFQAIAPTIKRNERTITIKISARCPRANDGKQLQC